jgi:hypothetical protein
MLRLEEPHEHNHHKQVNIVMNGNPEKSFILPYRHHLELSDVIKAIESKWNLKCSKSIRLFNHEGVEYECDDLKYVRHNDNMYFSRGIIHQLL